MEKRVAMPLAGPTGMTLKGGHMNKDEMRLTHSRAGAVPGLTLKFPT